MNNGSSREIRKVITFNSNVRFRRITYWDARNWTTEALGKFKWSSLFTRMSDSGASHIETLQIEQRRLLRNSNGHNFSHGGPVQEHNILSRSKLNNGRSREIQMVITFLSDVRFKCITYWDARNWTMKLSRNSNSPNFSHGCPIRAHYVSRRSKLNTGSSRDIQIAITFNSDVRFRCITYRDAWN